MSWPNDAYHEAAGQHATNRGYKSAYLVAPNYQAGKDSLAGFKRFYKGKVAAEVYTKLGQLDYSAELAEIRAAKPDDSMRAGASAPGAMSHEGHFRQIENLVDALRHGASLAVDGPEARKAVALILALYRSAQSGQPVTL